MTGPRTEAVDAMHVTLLGSGDALGVPVPLCDCRYCETAPRRRRPSLLVESADATLLFDASPDLPEQLRETNITDPDAVFLTHHHFDHVGGLKELNHAAMAPERHVLDPSVYDDPPPHTTVAVHATPQAATHLQYRAGGVHARLDPAPLTHGDPVTVGDVRVVPFPVEHARPAFDTVGFAVHADGAKLVYAPDLHRFAPDREAGDRYTDADLLVVEGSALFGAETHGPREALARAVADADADRTVLVNVNEHLQRQSTDALRDTARAAGYELGSDFARFSL